MVLYKIFQSKKKRKRKKSKLKSVTLFIYFILKKDPELEEDLYKYFCRISESYVALFLSIDSSMRDKIIQVHFETHLFDFF